jgi:hypothetical protein
MDKKWQLQSPNMNTQFLQSLCYCYGLNYCEARQGNLATTKRGNTRQDKIGQYWRIKSSIDPSTGVGMLEECPLDHLLL